MHSAAGALVLAVVVATVVTGPAAVAPARAADKPQPAGPGGGKPAGRLLTPAQLRDCFAQQERLRARTGEMARQQAVLAADKAEIDRLAVALKDQVALLDRTSADAVAAHNAQAEVRDRMIDAYQGGVPAFNGQVESLKTEREAYAKACENRRYDENDEIMLRKGK